jgi:putative SOS response-associated peptidase YedK
MPVIIPVNRYEQWLSNSLTPNEMNSFFISYSDAEMDNYTISKRITSRTEDKNVAAVIEPLQYPELLFSH